MKRKEIFCVVLPVLFSFIFVFSACFQTCNICGGPSDLCDCAPVAGEYCIFEDSVYLLTANSSLLKKYGIDVQASMELADASLGETTQCSSAEYTTGAVYSIKGRESNSVLLLQRDTQVDFILYSNPLAPDSLPWEEFLSLHGIRRKEAVTKVEIDGTALTPEDSLLFWSRFLSAKSVTSEDFFQNRYLSDSKSGQVAIEIMKDTEHYMSFWLYTDTGYINANSCYYLLPETARKQLTELL